MSRPDKEGLLSRWSRLKRASSETAASDDETALGDAPATPTDASASGDKLPVAGNASDPLPELPSLDELTPDSDFSAFMDPRVDDGVRRAALKTLFRGADFNVTDGLDVYAEDYTKLEKLTPAMVATLKYAQRTLFGKKDGRDEPDAVRHEAGCGKEDQNIDDRQGASALESTQQDVSPGPGISTCQGSNGDETAAVVNPEAEEHRAIGNAERSWKNRLPSSENND